MTVASQIGLALDREGQLGLDEAAFRSQLAADLDGVVSFFSGPDSLADQLRSAADVFVDPIDGSLVARINGVSTSIADLEDNISNAEERLETVEENLVLQFAALERTVAQLQQQGNFLTQFVLGTLGAT